MGRTVPTDLHKTTDLYITANSGATSRSLDNRTRNGIATLTEHEGVTSTIGLACGVFLATVSKNQNKILHRVGYVEKQNK